MEILSQHKNGARIEAERYSATHIFWEMGSCKVGRRFTFFIKQLYSATKGPVNWPPGSCDLKPLDYFYGAQLNIMPLQTSPLQLTDSKATLHHLFVRYGTNLLWNGNPIFVSVGPFRNGLERHIWLHLCSDLSENFRKQNTFPYHPRQKSFPKVMPFGSLNISI